MRSDRVINCQGLQVLEAKAGQCGLTELDVELVKLAVEPVKRIPSPPTDVVATKLLVPLVPPDGIGAVPVPPPPLAAPPVPLEAVLPVDAVWLLPVCDTYPIATFV